MTAATPTRPHEPEPAFADPDHLSRVLGERLLPLVTKPARYIGHAHGARRDPWDRERANLLLAFPDAYEVAMSHLGLRLLYHLVNAREENFCDLACAPWPDMEQEMRRFRMPLFGLETRRAARDFDVIGFSLGYELSYTGVLTMLDLAGLALDAAARRDDDPLVVAGGTCTLNPTVMGGVCDLMLLGDGEDALLELLELVAAGKQAGWSRPELRERARTLPGAWHPDTTAPVRPRVVADLAAPPPPALVPIVEPVHDRATVEVMRGCSRGCRFCQAGMIHRPVREREAAAVLAAALEETATGGYDEISCLALSAADYGELGTVLRELHDALAGRHVNIVLPSLRADTIDAALAARIGRERPSSFTLAPEAGTQRLRDVINKQITEEEILAAVGEALAGGIKRFKLYFMIGLPTETEADLAGIVTLVDRIAARLPRGAKQLNVAISPFAPKAHTPFQWAGQISRAEIERRNRFLAERLAGTQLKLALRDPEVSHLEAVLGLGDRRVGEVVREAWRRGARFEAWTETFDFAIWSAAFAAVGIDSRDYIARRDPADPLPWDGIAGPVDRDFLAADWVRAQRGETLADCRLTRTCHDCDACREGREHVFAARGEGAAATATAAGAAVAAEPRPHAGEEDPRWEKWRHQAAEKCWYRLEYAKKGDLIFLGHLDFQRQLELALRRSGLPLAHSKGYHRHPLMKFGPPLPVGVAGERETLDLALAMACSNLKDVLNGFLPAGLAVRGSSVVGAQTPPAIDQFVTRCEYRVVLPPPADGGPTRAQAAAAIERFLASESWRLVHQRPKGDIAIDVRPLVPESGLVLTDYEPGAERRELVLRVALLRDARGAHFPVREFLAGLFPGVMTEPRWCRYLRTAYRGQNEFGRWQTPLEFQDATGRRHWLRARLYG